MPGKKVDVDGKQIQCRSNILLPQEPAHVASNLPQDGKKVIGYREAMTLENNQNQ